MAAVDHCLEAFAHGKHVVNVTVEADAFCGPLLAQRPASVVVANRSNAKSDALVNRHKAVAERMGVQPDALWEAYGAKIAAEGMAGHSTVVGRRGAGYVAELPLTGGYPGLLVSGRADGYDPAQNLLEEIKTHRGDVMRIPANHRLLH